MIRRIVRGIVIAAGAWVVVTASAQTPPAQTPPPQTPPPASPAQTAPAPQQPTFRSSIDTVQVDVSVSDKQGRPISDLQIGDFEIRENKQSQPVQTFKLIYIDDAVPTPMRDILNARDQERELAREDTRLFIIYLDDYHTRRGNAMRVREQLAQFVSQLSNNDLLAVMTPLTEPSALTFSYNHDATARVVYAFEGRKYDYTPKNSLEARYVQLPPEQIEQWRNSIVINSLESTAEYIGAVRPGRKTILYVGEGLNSSVPVGMAVGGFGTGANSAQSMASDLQIRMARVYQTAARANTSISTFDPRGLATSETMAASPMAMEQDRQLLNESVDLLRTMANETDGRAVVATNNPFPGFQLMLRDLGAYYLLGYKAVSPHDGKFHEIQVRVNRKDIEVHARKGYWAYTADEAAKASAPPKPPPPADLTSALGSLASSLDRVSGRLVRTWTGSTRAEGGKATVTLAWEAAAASSPAGAPDSVDHLTVIATHITGEQLFSGRVTADPQSGRPSGVVTFLAPPGSVRLRIVPENAKNLRLDAQEETVEVPNFESSKPVITTPVVYRGRTVVELRTLKASAAPMPVITREFQRSDRLLMRFQAFGPAGAPTALKMKILNQQGVMVAELPPPTATPAGYEAEFGLNSFPSGTYLIEISGDFGGQSARSLFAIHVSG